jgi:hypothetical protein
LGASNLRSVGLRLTFSGWAGLYRGYLISLLTMFPQSAISYGIYYGVAHRELESGWTASALPVASPVLAASLSSMACHPLDTLRKRLMLIGLGTTAKSAVFKPRLWLKETLKTEGWAWLMNGWTINFTRNLLLISLVSLRQSGVYGGVEAK